MSDNHCPIETATTDTIDRAEVFHETPPTWAFRVFVPGIPRPQPRPRFVGTRPGQKPKVISVCDRKTQLWIESVTYKLKSHAEDHGGIADVRRMLTGPIKATFHFYIPMAFRAAAKAQRDTGTTPAAPCVKKPDYDNLAKLISDASVKSGVTPDDCMVSHAEIIKTLVDQKYAGVMITYQRDTLPRYKPLGEDGKPAWL